MSKQDVEIYDPPSNGGKDYILQVKIRNGPLLRAIRMRGYKNASQFCQKTGMNYQIVMKYLSLSNTPISTGQQRRGQWKKSALELAKCLKIPPDALFPEQHLERALAKISGEIEISADEVATLIEFNGQGEIEDKEIIYGTLEKLLLTLTPREERVVRMRYGLDGGGEKTLDDVGQTFNVQRERIRQIEARALRKLKHPCRITRLAEAGCVEAQNWLAKERSSAAERFANNQREMARRDAQENLARMRRLHEEQKERGEQVRAAVAALTDEQLNEKALVCHSTELAVVIKIDGRNIGMASIDFYGTGPYWSENKFFIFEIPDGMWVCDLVKSKETVRLTMTYPPRINEAYWFPCHFSKYEQLNGSMQFCGHITGPIERVY